MKLRPQYPASFSILLLVGFILVALPLLGGMLNTTYRVERIVDDGQRAIEATLSVTRASRQLVVGVSDLQRAAGQYYVLEDASLRRSLSVAHRSIRRALAVLNDQPLEPAQRALLTELDRQEAALHAQLRAGGGQGPARFEAFGAAFDRLYQTATRMETEGHRYVDGRVAALGAAAQDLRRALTWQSLAMIPLSLFLTVLFSWLISRPVRQLAGMIRRLGDNDLSAFAPVEGPRDLAYLGGRLDWLRQRLIGLEQQQQRFLRHVSHELKTPLAALREGVELMLDGVVGDLAPRQEEVARIMRGNVRELQRRIEDLIAFNRASQHLEPLVAADLALGPLIATAVSRHALAISAKSLRISAELKGVRVMGDKCKLETVFENLLGNAIRFSPAGGRIEIGADSTGRQVAITIRDQGPGVPVADRANLFDPFYQGGIQPPGAISGSGLGLSIVKEYVEAHGGQVSLVETASARGACFRVLLPPGTAHGRR